MRKNLICISGFIALAAILLLSLLPIAVAQENNSTMLNNITLSNTTLNNNTAPNNIALNAAGNKVSNQPALAASQQESISAGSAFQIGKGLKEDAHSASSLSKDSTLFQIEYGNIKEPIEVGQPVAPVRDLEKIVFICNII